MSNRLRFRSGKKDLLGGGAKKSGPVTLMQVQMVLFANSESKAVQGTDSSDDLIEAEVSMYEYYLYESSVGLLGRVARF